MRQTEDAKALKAKAERYCSMEEQCCQQVRQKLKEWGSTAQTAEQIIAELIEERYIDEERYVALYIRSKVGLQHWGKRKIASQLYGKGIANDLIEKGLREIDEDEYKRIANAVAQKKWIQTQGAGRERTRRVTQYMLSRGYEMGDWEQQEEESAERE